jgi:hypothetical protein
LRAGTDSLKLKRIDDRAVRRNGERILRKAPILLLFALLTAVAPARVAAGEWWAGGGIGLAFGGDVTHISVEPLIGYWINPKLTVGGRLIFRYRKDERSPDSQSTMDYGAAVFTRYFATKRVFLQGEYEYLSYELPTASAGRDGFNSLFGGAGFSQPLGGRSSFFISGLYNFLYRDDEPSPYADPWVLRAGVGFGF